MTDSSEIKTDITALSAADAEEIIAVWEKSVKATHLFLTPGEIEFYKPYVRKYAIPECRLFGIREQDGRLTAFMGLSTDKIEMLFVTPEYFGRRYGSRLIAFAERQLGIRKVDVNEENTKALGFYQKIGFRIAGRSETDGNGKPHPILFLEK